MTRRADLAKIHIARKDLGLDDDDYRALLRRVTGMHSAGSLEEDERGRVLAELAKLGWRPAKAAAGSAPHGAPAQRRKIAALLAAAGRPVEYGAALAKKMYRKRLEFCSAGELRGVIAALEKDRQRRGGGVNEQNGVN